MTCSLLSLELLVERHLVVSKLILVTPMLLQLADDVALRLDESEVDSRLCSHIGLPSKIGHIRHTGILFTYILFLLVGLLLRTTLNK